MKFKQRMAGILSLSILLTLPTVPAQAEKITDTVVFSQDFNTTWVNPWDWSDSDIYAALDYNTDNKFKVYRGTMTPAVGDYGLDGTKACYLNARNGGTCYYLEQGEYVSYTMNASAGWTNVEIPFAKTSESALTDGYYVMTFDYYPSAGYEVFRLSGDRAFADQWVFPNSDTAFNGSSDSLPREWHKVTITANLDDKVVWVSIRNAATEDEVYETHWNYTRGLGMLVLLSDHGSLSESEFSKPENSAMIDNILIQRRSVVPEPRIRLINRNNGTETDPDNVSNKLKEITVDFGTAVDESTLSESTVRLTEDETSAMVECIRDYSGNIYTLTPLGELKEETDYALVIDGVCYDDGEPVDAQTVRFTTEYDDVIEEVIGFQEDFENVTNSDLVSWRNNYNLYENGSFRIYSTTPNTNNCIWSDDGNSAMYLAVKSSNKNQGAMQMAVSDAEGNELKSGRYKLTYDFYPANGQNTLTLVKSSDVSEGMATYTGGAALMRDEAFLERVWYSAEIGIDLDKNKASMVIADKSDGTEVYTNEIAYTDDLRVFNFNMSGTNVCTKDNSAIFDNFSFSEILSVPAVNVSVTDVAGEKQTDFTQEIKGIGQIEIDFGMSVVESTINDDTVFLSDKNGNKVAVTGVVDGNVYRMTPDQESDDNSEYTLVLTGEAKYAIGDSAQKACRNQKLILKTGDSRVDPKVSVIGGDDKEVFDTTDLLCAVKEIRVDFRKPVREDTLSGETVVLAEKQGGQTVLCDRAYENGVYTLIPHKLEEGVLYELSVRSEVQYESGKTLREYTQDISIFSGQVNYFQDFENESDFGAWSASNVFDLYEQSPIVRYYGSTLQPGSGHDGSTAFLLCTMDNPNSPIVNRDIEIPFGKSLKTMGVYEVTCDYYPSAGLDCINLRGNHKFAAGYGVTDGIQLCSLSIEEREWMTLTVRVDLDRQTAEYAVTLKETGATVQKGSQNYRNALGLIEFYMQEDSDTKGKIWMQENSMMLDNIRITRLPYESAPAIDESQLEFYAGGMLQEDRNGINCLTDSIRIVPTQEILMSSITRDFIYLQKEGDSDKLYCTMTYKDGIITIQPDERLEPEEKYILCVDALENPDGYRSAEFRKGFRTAKSALTAFAEPSDESAWTVKRIKKDGAAEIVYTVLNATREEQTLHFVISYYNDDYSRLLKTEEKKITVLPMDTTNDHAVFDCTGIDFAHIGITVLKSLSEMNVISTMKEPE